MLSLWGGGSVMHAKQSTYVLEVVGGDDHGARLDVDERVRTIGRARDVDLVLRDLGVSRRHVQVAATANGVQFDICGGAAPLMVGGRHVRSVEAKEGDRVLLGNTLLVVVTASRDSTPSSVRGSRDHTDVKTLLTGVGADARAMASVHALIEALDVAQDPATLEGVIRAWASEQTPACSVEVRQGTDASTGSEISETEEAGSSALILIPTSSEEPVTLAFRCEAPRGRLTDSFRRTLVVAGRLFGSSFARVRRAEIVDSEVAALRALSFGSARGFLGTSPGAQQLASLVPKLATSDVSVLIEGETGVGKTFVARLIHEASPRAREPLRVINCAAIPENLVESELFGHERGAFTGAGATRVGALEAAGKGTLFLDEIGELSLGSQAKLLRVVEDRRFERIGSNRTIELRARLLCATNRDLEAMADAGQFRRDLLFRIAVVRVRVPALRERGDDLVQLAKQLLADSAQSAGRRVTGFSLAALDLIRRYSWPGNVRELRNAIEHALALGEGALVETCDLPAGIAPRATQPEDPDVVRLPLDLVTLERHAIEAALRATNGNRVRAAALLGINRATLYNKLKEYGDG